MRLCSLTRRAVLVAAAMLPLLQAPARADADYPNRSILLIVPFAPGGATDVLARIFADKMRETWKQPVVVENRQGAGGNIGSAAVAKAEPDGYTLLMGAIGTNAVNQALYASMPYDTARDFAPITQIARLPMLLVVHPSVPAKNVAELIALAKQKPGELNHGSAGKGASQHLAATMFESVAGVKFQHVFYRGAAALVPDLLNGNVQVTFGDMVSLLPHVQSGALRALAVTTNVRSKTVPDLPTIAEAGLPNYDASAWYGFFAPRGTKPEIVNKLHAELTRHLSSPDIVERFKQLGADPVGSKPEEFAAFVRSEMERWGAVVKAAGITAN